MEELVPEKSEASVIRKKHGRPRKHANSDQIPLNPDGSISNITAGELAKKRAEEQTKNNAIFTSAEYDPNDISSVLYETNYWRARGLNARVTTDDELMGRIEEYFNHCMERGIKSTVETLCLAIGYSRAMVARWKLGIGCTRERQAIICSAYDTFAAFDATMAVNNKLNPVLYFFRAKNYYDMRDQQDVVVSPNNPLGDTRSPEEIAEEFNLLTD